MNKLIFDINTFWLYAVILHIVGSVVFSVMGILPLGNVLCLTIMWGVYIYVSEKSQKQKMVALFGWIVSGVLLFLMPVSYRSSFFMNLLMLLLVYYVCKQRNLNIIQYCALKKIPFRQWGILLLSSITFLIIAAYVNAVSMLFVNNMTSASLQDAGRYLPQSIFVFAVLPAVTEEIMFRGYIFRGIAHKKTAIFLSAGMFALLHMNFNQMSYAFVMGILFGVLVCVTNNLSMTIIVHLLFNFYNILFAAFPKNTIIVWIQNIHIAGYPVLAPSFYNQAGNFSGRLFFIGSIVVLATVLITFILLTLLKEKKIKSKDVENGLPWKPNRIFWAGCFVCLLIAVSYEYMI